MERTKFDVPILDVQNRAMQFFMPSSQAPMMWWRGKPVSLTMLLVLIHVAAVIVTSLLMGFKQGQVLSAMVYTNQAVLNGEVWRLLTFPLYQFPTFWIVIEVFMLWMFGSQVEQALGWRTFLAFYLVVCIGSAIAFLPLARWISFPIAGTDAANFGVFIGFTTLFPDAPMLFNTKAKWWAWAMLGLLGLQLLAFASSIAATVLVGAGVAYLYLKTLGVQGGFAWFNRWQREREAARQEKIEQRRYLESKDHFISEQVDPILDKIAREGMQSLTDEEKRILERAKDKLR
jgi:membrane associated rhomboid family serine protease